MVGPAGIGKTTVHRALLVDRERGWLSWKEAALETAGLEVESAIFGFRGPSRRAVLQRLAPRSYWTTPSVVQRAWRRYLAWCDHMIARVAYEGAFLPLTRRLALNTAVVEIYGVSRPVVYHESISRRGLSFGLRHTDGLEFMRRYYWWIPPPAAVLWFRAEPDVILERVRSRRMVAAPQRGLTADQILAQARWSDHALDVAADILARRGTRVIEIDANFELSALTANLRSALTECCAP
jgi:hypothetical protein